MITAGIYLDYPTDDYLKDPCPEPSLTQSIAKKLLDQSPRHAWVAHPRLNPDFEPDDPTKFDMGNIAHLLMLGRGKDIVTVDADDWKTKAAREAREKAKADGKLCVLERQYKTALEMSLAGSEQLKAIDSRAFTEGNGEVVAVVQDGPVWLRTMIDWMVSPTIFYDYKTTKRNAAPHLVGGTMASMGWDVQAAMQEHILDILDPDNAGRRTFRFVHQEDYEPYALTVVELTEGVLEIGRQKVRRAIERWTVCMQTKQWPSYSTEIVRPEYPSWAQTQWLNREEAEDV